MTAHIQSSLPSGDDCMDAGGRATQDAKAEGRGEGNMLTDNLPLLAGAPNGIKKLRELILELAVRGKLLPQDSSDEPASELLKRIEAEKARLVAEGKIKKQKPLAEMTEEEKPFELPQGWVWTRNNQLFTLRKGKKPKTLSADNIGLPYLDVAALDRNDVRQFTSDTSCPQAKAGDLLVICDGSRSGLILEGKHGVVGSTLAVISTPEFFRDYLKLLFEEAYFRLNSNMKGAAIPHLDTKGLSEHLVGLPPIEEQHRIVAKVDELMALCDTLETQQADAESAHARLVECLLGSLTSARDAAAFAASWQRLAVHFDSLFTTEQSIDALKQCLLQLAVMGKLVPQDRNDEPASELLKRIQAEKERLIAEGEIKKQKPLAEISKDEKPFEIPTGWQLVQLADVSILITDGTHQTPKYVPSGRPFLSAQNVKPFKFMPENHRFVSQEDFDGLRKNRVPQKGDILMTRVGAMIGEAAVIDVDIEFAFYVSLALVKLSRDGCDPKFIVLWLNSPFGTALSIKNTLGRGVSAGNLNLSLIRGFKFGLPPLAEQHRIVAKVDRLFALCDQLKARLNQACALHEQLASTLVEQAVADHNTEHAAA